MAEFSSSNEMDRAIKELDDTELGGKRIRVIEVLNVETILKPVKLWYSAWVKLLSAFTVLQSSCLGVANSEIHC